MTSERRQVGWGFWLWWVLLILVGVVMGFAIRGFGTEEGAFLGGAAVVGAVQWLFMRWQGSRASWRPLTSMGGYAVGFAATHAVLHVIIGPVRFAVTWTGFAIVSAVITGIALLWLLRQPVSESPES